MKCYIRRCKYNDKNELVWLNTYLKPYYDERKREYTYITHWVCLKQEAQQFESIAEARWIIKTYNLKNCEVYK